MGKKERISILWLFSAQKKKIFYKSFHIMNPVKNDSILFSVNWYPFISWWPFESRPMYQRAFQAHLSKSDKLYSPLGIFAVLRCCFMAFTKSWGLLKYCFTKSYDFTSCIRRFVLQNSLGFFPERLNWSYAPSAWIISISISGAVMTFLLFRKSEDHYQPVCR